jgi:hypothetical protein
MTPLCKIEVTLRRVLGSREVPVVAGVRQSNAALSLTARMQSRVIIILRPVVV